MSFVQQLPVYYYLSLSFTTADVTPPSLVFLTSQRTSNENFTIFWRFDEEATATCTLQTPTDQLTEICNNGTFMRTRLKGGLHFLFVQGTDLAGNTGRPRRYDWIVGKCALLPGRSTSQPYQISLREFSIFNAIK